MKKLLLLLPLVFLSCDGYSDFQKVKRIEVIYDYLIMREIQNPRGMDLFIIDSLSKEKERKIKIYSKV